MRLILPLIAAPIIVLSACQEAPKPQSSDVSFTLINSASEDIGTVKLRDMGHEGVKLIVQATQTPEGPHGIHFHVKADCRAPDFKSAGGHINPEGHQHGLKNPDGPDNADMPNVVADETESLSYEYTNARVTLNERDDRPALLDHDGSALMIHINADDQVTQPIGGAGARIACAELK
ncbi:MAG: superoxide dismutase family protein [Hellea sp.]